MPWCPNCKTEYQDGYTVCSDCGSTLVESLEQAATEDAAEYIRDAAASFPDDTGFETEEYRKPRRRRCRRERSCCTIKPTTASMRVHPTRRKISNPALIRC